jgi:hypothetical protein
MLDSYDLSDEAKLDVVEFVDANKDRMRELSLRTVLKVADLRASFPDKWKSVAEMTCMRGSR